MSFVVGVSSSHYYLWKYRTPSVREQANATLVIQVTAIFEGGKKRSSSQRITRDLRDEGIVVGRHRVAKIIRQNGLRAKAARKYKAATNIDQFPQSQPNPANWDSC